MPVRLHRERSGSGVPVVLSHGLGDDAETWAALVPRLATDHTVVTWDLRGHRHSEAPTDGYSAEIAIADLSALVVELGEPVHLVGHSLGGYLSLAVSLRRPELVRSLTMISSGPGYRDPSAREEWNRYVERAVLRMPVPPAAAGLGRQEDSWVIDRVGDLQPPLLVVVGERDMRFHAGADFLARAVPGSTLLRVAGAGHHPQQTHADEVAGAVLKHLAAAEDCQ